MVQISTGKKTNLPQPLPREKNNSILRNELWKHHTVLRSGVLTADHECHKNGANELGR